MGELREVPGLHFIGNLCMDADAFASDAIDAADAKMKLNPVMEQLGDSMKPMLKQALAEVIQEQLHDRAAGVTLTCEE